MAGPKHAALAEEAAEVEVLSANLSKLKSLSKKIEGSMGRLEASGRTVQEGIGPVMSNTQELQTMVMNVTRILSAIDRVREPLDKRRGEERILRERPDRVGLSEYMASMDRTIQHLRELKAMQMRSNQQAVTELTALLQVASQNLEGVFRDITRQDSIPVEPLRFITKSTDFPRLPPNNSSQLRSINHQIGAFASQVNPNEMSPSAKAYVHERGQYITQSLQNLASACLSTARRMNATETYKQNSCGIGTYASGLFGMYGAEYDNICDIFGREEWRGVLTATCQSSLSTFGSTMKELDNHIRANLLGDCYLAYEIVDIVSNTAFQLENYAIELKQSVSDAMKPVRETAKSSLSALLVDMRTKSQQIVSLPPTGGIVQLTPDVMQRLQTMTIYMRPLSSIMRSIGDGGWSTSSNGNSQSSSPGLKGFDVGADGEKLFANYCIDTIETLLSNLHARAKSLHRSKAIQGVFLANNVAVIERMIQTSELQSLLGEIHPKLEHWRKLASKDYLDAWRDLSKELLDVQYTNKQQRPSSTSGAPIDSATILKNLSSKDRDGIKEKFRSFNVAFDEHLAKHKSCKMEPEVRRQLSKEVQGFIEPLYGRFWERYHDIDRGKGKYVKYDKSQLSSMLALLT